MLQDQTMYRHFLHQSMVLHDILPKRMNVKVSGLVMNTLQLSSITREQPLHEVTNPDITDNLRH